MARVKEMVSFMNLGPRGICTDRKGRVLVADYSNKRIQVFTSEGNFIKSIPCDGKPYDVAVDPEGNVHLSLQDIKHICVYSEDGKQVETYNIGGELFTPRGIHIDSEGKRYICQATSVLIADRR